jgi:hypothetical protein
MLRRGRWIGGTTTGHKWTTTLGEEGAMLGAVESQPTTLWRTKHLLASAVASSSLKDLFTSLQHKFVRGQTRPTANLSREILPTDTPERHWDSPSSNFLPTSFFPVSPAGAMTTIHRGANEASRHFSKSARHFQFPFHLKSSFCK